MRNRVVELVQQEALRNPDTVFLTGDIGYSVIEPLKAAIGERFINAGVAEANMASMAAALAMNGYRAYIYSITPFVTLRCIEQIRNDICYQGKNVRILGIGAGFSYGTLGPSHHALEDATVLAALPGMNVLCPAGRPELEAIFDAYADVDEPIYFRIGREKGPDLVPPALTRATPAWVIRDGDSCTALCSGAVVEKALEAATLLEANNIALRVVSVPVMHPYPTAVRDLLCDGPVITVAEAYPDNPLEVGTLRLLQTLDRIPRFKGISVAQRFPKIVGNHDTLRAQGGLSTQAIVDAVIQLTSAGRRT